MAWGGPKTTESQQRTSLGLSLVADVGVLLPHPDHDALVTGTADDRREDGPRGVISGETSLQCERIGIGRNKKVELHLFSTGLHLLSTESVQNCICKVLNLYRAKFVKY